MGKSKRETAWKCFSKYIRVRDAVETTSTVTHARCITCGKVLHIEDMDAGHAIAGRGNAILFVEELCHAQCRACNRFSNGRLQAFKAALIESHGQAKWEEWEALKRTRVKFSDADYVQIADKYREKTKELKEKRGVKD